MVIEKYLHQIVLLITKYCSIKECFRYVSVRKSFDLLYYRPKMLLCAYFLSKNTLKATSNEMNLTTQ